METTHFARKPKSANENNPEANSGDDENPQVELEASLEQSVLADMSIITETASLISTVEHGELMESIAAGAELPQLSAEEVEINLPDTQDKHVNKPIPYEVIRQRYKVKQLLKPPAGSSIESQPVEEKAASETVVTPSSVPLEASRPNQPGQPQPRPPVTHRVTSQRAASPATRIKSWRKAAERRSNPPPPGGARGSTRSRSPAREAHGYQRRDPRRARSPRSPRRVERRGTPRSSPARRLQHERGRQEPTRDHRPRDRELSMEQTNEQLFSEFLTFMSRRRK